MRAALSFPSSADTTDARATTAGLPRSSQSQASILVVDDDLKTLTAMEALLAGPGRRIVTAASSTLFRSFAKRPALPSAMPWMSRPTAGVWSVPAAPSPAISRATLRANDPSASVRMRALIGVG